MRLASIVGLLVLGMATPSRTVAQQTTAELPVSGSMIYNWVFYDRPSGTIGQGSSGRFMGRVSLRLSARTYLGAGVGSWVNESRPCFGDGSCATDSRSAHSEAVVHQVYLQRYLVGATGFARLGAGLASTRTLVPDGEFMRAREHWRPAVSVGAGADLHLDGLLYLSPSIDYVVLSGAEPAQREIRSGLAFGLGLTLR